MSFAEEFNSSLTDLRLNSKPLINMLTMLAEDYIENASTIVELVEGHLKKVPDDAKLAVLYLIDSIVKNVGKDYAKLFGVNIVEIFCSVFEKGCEKTRSQLFKLRQTWNSVFGMSLMHDLDKNVKKIDPAWPSVRILVNPKFFQDPREEILKHQKELLELEKKKLEILTCLEPKKRKSDIEMLFGNEDTDLRKKMKTEIDPDRTIEIDKVEHQVRFYGETAVIIKNGDPRELSFQGGLGKISINNAIKHLPFTAPYTEFKVGQEYLQIKFGAPTREIYINGKAFTASFDGPPITFGRHQIKLLSPMPKVQIGKSRTDLVLGKTNLDLDGEQHTLFLDFKDQKVNDDVIKFGDAFQKVSVNGTWYEFEFEKTLEVENRKFLFTNPIKFEKINVPELMKNLVRVGIVPDDQKIDFDCLKVRNCAAIDGLYGGLQCATCGLRFPEEKQNHLDWHYEINKEKPENRRLYPKYFLRKGNYNDGIASASILGDDKSCTICSDDFEQYFDENTEEFRFKNATRIEGKLFHPKCHRESQENSQDILEIKEIRKEILFYELSSECSADEYNKEEESDVEFDLSKVKVEKVEMEPLKASIEGDLEFESPSLVQTKKIKINITSIPKPLISPQVQEIGEFEEKKITKAKSVKESIARARMKEMPPVETGKETSALCSLM